MRSSLALRFGVLPLGGLLAVGCTAPSGVAGGLGSAACSAPTVRAVPETVAPGATLVIAGEGWGPCNDTNQAPYEPPWTSATVELIQDGASTPLATVDLHEGRFADDVTIPAEVPPGDASLRVVSNDYQAEAPMSVDTGRP